MINRVVLVGRMTRDPELRRTPQGDAVTSFTLAVNRNYTSRDGQQQADFINCVVRSYDNSQGQKVYVVEVICDSVQFLETRAARERAQSQPQMQQNNDNFYDMKTVELEKELKTVELEKEFDNSFNTYDIMEDDIQF